MAKPPIVMIRANTQGRSPQSPAVSLFLVLAAATIKPRQRVQIIDGNCPAAKLQRP